MSGVGSVASHQRSSSTFVDEYSGVVGFYTHLAQSWRYKTPFLGRSLSYKRAAHEEERTRLNGKKNSSHPRVLEERAGRISDAHQSHHASVDDDLWGSTRALHGSRTSVIYRLRYNDGQQEWCVC